MTGSTADRIAICQHPDGPGEYVPAEDISNGNCFMDCDCTPRVYVAVDSQSSGEARAAYWEESAFEWRRRVVELEVALGHAQTVAGRFMSRGHAGFEYDGINDELALTLQELSLIHRTAADALLETKDPA